MDTRRRPSLSRTRSPHSPERILAECTTAHNPLLTVVELNGRRRLDGLTVNYSCGSLEDVLRTAFDAFELERRPIQSALILGFGAGSAVRLLRRLHGKEVEFVAVEIDPVVVDFARRWFGFDGDPHVEFAVADARAFVESDARKHDFVLVNVFVDDIVPSRLRDARFARDVARRLTPGGVLVFNTLTDTNERRTESAEIDRALKEAFGRIDRLDVGANRIFSCSGP